MAVAFLQTSLHLRSKLFQKAEGLWSHQILQLFLNALCHHAHCPRQMGESHEASTELETAMRQSLRRELSQLCEGAIRQVP